MAHPMPCAHCGMNFMFHNLDKEASKLCNNCVVREDLRTNKKKGNMQKNINILISCPEQDQKEIEEYCMQNGIDYSRYFLELHYSNQIALEEMKKISRQPRQPVMGKTEIVEDKNDKKKVKK
jgi:hypothetical protein